MIEIKNFNISQPNLPYLFSKIQDLDLSLGYVCNVTLKSHIRSLDSNARLWKLYTSLGEYIGESSDKVHELMTWKFLRSQSTVNGETIEVVKSTTKLTTAEMADYQNKIELWAGSIGFAFNDAP
jgi:hypothetical protein